MAMPCDRCGGKGRIARERRMLSDGSFDPFDYRFQELCGKCGGSGEQPEPPAVVVEPRRGYAADFMSLTIPIQKRQIFGRVPDARTFRGTFVNTSELIYEVSDDARLPLIFDALDPAHH